MKKLLKTTLLLSLMVLAACQMIEETLVNLTSDVEEMQLYTNPSDPTILKMVMKDGLEYTFFGDKDAEGNPNNIKTIYTQYPGDSDPFVTEFSNDMVVERIMAPNGALYEFFFTDERNYRILLTWPDGEYSLSIPYTIEDDSTGNSAKGFNRKNISRLEILPEARIKEIDFPHVKPIKNSGNNMSFTIFQCGVPVNNAIAKIITIPPLSSGGIPLNKSGDGYYSASIPHEYKDAIIDDECSNYVDKMNKICLGYAGASFKLPWQNELTNQDICNRMETAINTAFPNMKQSTKDKITANCPKMIKLIPDLCKVKDKYDLLKGCKLAKYFNTMPVDTEYQYQLQVFVPGQGTEITEATVFDPDNPGSWDWDIGGEFRLQNVVTDPADPGPHGSYTASAIIYCPMPEGTPVTISVVGSDGYANSRSMTMTNTGEITLWVPGAEDKVSDVITVTAVFEGIEYISQTSITF